jgi:hypothetical protein
MQEDDSLKHIDWVDLDNIIIASSKQTLYDEFLDKIKGEECVRIVKLITNKDNHYDKIIVIKNKIFYYINYQIKSKDYYIQLITEINSNGFLPIYKEFDREEKLKEILKSDK